MIEITEQDYIKAYPRYGDGPIWKRERSPEYMRRNNGSRIEHFYDALLKYCYMLHYLKYQFRVAFTDDGRVNIYITGGMKLHEKLTTKTVPEICDVPSDLPNKAELETVSLINTLYCHSGKSPVPYPQEELNRLLMLSEHFAISTGDRRVICFWEGIFSFAPSVSKIQPGDFKVSVRPHKSLKAYTVGAKQEYWTNIYHCKAWLEKCAKQMPHSYSYSESIPYRVGVDIIDTLYGGLFTITDCSTRLLKDGCVGTHDALWRDSENVNLNEETVIDHHFISKLQNLFNAE